MVVNLRCGRPPVVSAGQFDGHMTTGAAMTDHLVTTVMSGDGLTDYRRRTNGDTFP